MLFLQTHRIPSHEECLFNFDDNDLAIKMTMVGRSSSMGHVSRTHRVDLDWLFDRIGLGPGIQIKFVDTTV